MTHSALTLSRWAKASRLLMSITLVSVAICRIIPQLSAGSFSSISSISEISAAWSPMRSMSVVIFSAAETMRRSPATGCCDRSRL